MKKHLILYIIIGMLLFDDVAALVLVHMGYQFKVYLGHATSYVIYGTIAEVSGAISFTIYRRFRHISQKLI